MPSLVWIFSISMPNAILGTYLYGKNVLFTWNSYFTDILYFVWETIIPQFGSYANSLELV